MVTLMVTLFFILTIVGLIATIICNQMELAAVRKAGDTPGWANFFSYWAAVDKWRNATDIALAAAFVFLVCLGLSMVVAP